ncbi:MAG: hypothetical protein U0105_22490 [Candidatus Obscuribacterales bacterium]
MSHTIGYAFDDDTTSDDFGTTYDGETFDDAPRLSRIGPPRAFRNGRNRERDQAVNRRRVRHAVRRTKGYNR